ncbi:hypothetical protein E2320_002264 [Naja naja]|nr:hypothetical protein E2320_002264 [Naja naja]
MAPKTVAISHGFSALLIIISMILNLMWAARTQPVVPCQAPLQWEGRTVEYDHSSGRNIRAMVSYDSPNQRLRILEEKKRFIPCKNILWQLNMLLNGYS